LVLRAFWVHQAKKIVVPSDEPFRIASTREIDVL
jgi:hypothetical protein